MAARNKVMWARMVFSRLPVWGLEGLDGEEGAIVGERVLSTSEAFVLCRSHGIVVTQRSAVIPSRLNIRVDHFASKLWMLR